MHGETLKFVHRNFY